MLPIQPGYLAVVGLVAVPVGGEPPLGIPWSRPVPGATRTLIVDTSGMS